jgi:hypothetical protein
MSALTEINTDKTVGDIQIRTVFKMYATDCQLTVIDTDNYEVSIKQKGTV